MRHVSLGLFACTIFASLPVRAQTPLTRQQTGGPCSVAINGNNNHVFTCKGLNQKTAAEILAILNKMRRDQLDPVAVMEKLDEIERSVEEMNKRSAQRRLTDNQKADILGQLSGLSPAKVSVMCIMGDGEGKAYAQDFEAIFEKVGWSSTLSESMWGIDPVGLELRYSSSDASASTIPADFQAVLNALKAAQVSATVVKDSSVNPVTVELIVGRKPGS